MKTIVPMLAVTTGFCLVATSAFAGENTFAEPPLAAVVDEIIDDVPEPADQLQEKVFKPKARVRKVPESKVVIADEPFAAAELIFDGETFDFGESSRGSTPPLIVRTGDLEPGTAADLQEDLVVMSRILGKTVEREVGRDGFDSAMGIVLSTVPGSRHPQCIYLEGYGALFFINVKFPLLPPAKEQEKPDKPADTDWEQTKRELYGQKSNVRLWSFNPAGEAVGEYDAEQVDSLRDGLLESLKHASNIRSVKPEEFITVAVVGNRAGSRGTRVKSLVARKGNVRRGDVFAIAQPAHTPQRESTLTFRVKKADVDAFAKADIDLDQFKKRVSVTAY